MRRWFWAPKGAATMTPTVGQIPDVGQVIGWGASRKAWRVVEVGERHQLDWHPATRQTWENAGLPDPELWEGRERVLLVEPARHPSPGGKDRCGLRLYPWWQEQQWWPLRDAYPACVDCGLLWPCPCDDQNRAAADAMAEVDRLTSIRAGCCWGCGEPITSRQGAVDYPGGNADLPGGPPVRFHTRGGCRPTAVAYELRWLAVDPSRQRILTYPKCPGMLVTHRDGSTECHPDPPRDPECGGHLTHDHDSRAACYAAGWKNLPTGRHCPRGCNPAGHPGCGTPRRPDLRREQIPGTRTSPTQQA